MNYFNVHSLGEEEVYPATLQKTSTQTVDSSQLFPRTNSPKATKGNQQDHKKLRQKHNQRYGTRLSQTRPPFTLLNVVAKDNFTLISIIFLFMHYLIKEYRRRRLNHFEIFDFVDDGKTFNIANFTTLNAALSGYQTILPCALHSQVWSCV